MLGSSIGAQRRRKLRARTRIRGKLTAGERDGAVFGGDLDRSNPCNCRQKQVVMVSGRKELFLVMMGSGVLYHGRKELFLLQDNIFKKPDSSQDQQLAQPPEEMHPETGEVAAQLVFGQDPCHPAPNYYGHYCTGTLVQGYQYGNQNVSDANVQTCSYWDHSSVGYPPSYGYEQSYYNYGNPHTNGGFVGVGDSMPQYLSYAQYEHPAQRHQQHGSSICPIQPSGAAASSTSAGPSVSGTSSYVPNVEGNEGATFGDAAACRLPSARQI